MCLRLCFNAVARYAQLEQHTPFADIWPTLHAAAPADMVGTRSVQQLVDVYDGGGDRSEWRAWYAPKVPCQVPGK